jgi:hypothetical protein
MMASQPDSSRSSDPSRPLLTVAAELETKSSASQEALRPLTERILARLPGPRALWVMAWAALPLVLLALPLTFNLISSSAGGTRAPSELVTAVVTVYVVTLSLWAARRMARDAARVEERLTALRPGGEAFREIGYVFVPLVMTVVTSVVGVVAAWTTTGASVPFALFALPFLINLPLMTALWTYLAVLIGLDRLGRRKLHLDDAFPADPGLGLTSVGAIAFRAFLIFVAGLLPMLVVSFVNPVYLILDLLLFLPGVGLFVLSLYRLHRQMVVTRHRHLERARALYVQAHGPHWESGNLADWQRDAGMLLAVAEMERRASSISTWPFSPSSMAVMLTLTIGLSVTLTGRLITFALGL